MTNEQLKTIIEQSRHCQSLDYAQELEKSKLSGPNCCFFNLVMGGDVESRVLLIICGNITLAFVRQMPPSILEDFIKAREGKERHGNTVHDPT